MREERRGRHVTNSEARRRYSWTGRGTCLLVKDYSDGGVRLQLNDFENPDDFVLLFAPNELLKVAVIRLSGA